MKKHSKVDGSGAPTGSKNMQIDGFDVRIHLAKKLSKNIFFKKFLRVSIPSILSNV
jgi:hypothetical protein